VEARLVAGIGRAAYPAKHRASRGANGAAAKEEKVASECARGASPGEGSPTLWPEPGKVFVQRADEARALERGIGGYARRPLELGSRNGSRHNRVPRPAGFAERHRAGPVRPFGDLTDKTRGPIPVPPGLVVKETARNRFARVREPPGRPSLDPAA